MGVMRPSHINYLGCQIIKLLKIGIINMLKKKVGNKKEFRHYNRQRYLNFTIFSLKYLICSSKLKLRYQLKSFNMTLEREMK